jgi:Fe-Mn family superoxide dismutase
MSSTVSYKARQFDLNGLQGISDETLELHFKLYEGYVKETNKLNEKIGSSFRTVRSIRKKCRLIQS